jgi:hypothetical protein
MKTRRRPLEPHGDFVNHLWQVAHGRLPIQAYDPQTRRTARPWLTTITDSYSHCVVGFHVELEPPSAAGVLHALRKHDSNPANNPQPPARLRCRSGARTAAYGNSPAEDGIA